MARFLPLALLCTATALVCSPGPVLAEDEQPAAEAPAQDLPAGPAAKPIALASDAEVAEALKAFKENFKAKGLPKEDKTSQRDWAMQQIAPLQHPDVIDALAKVTRSSDADLRQLALIYLGDQKALPHLAAKPILAAMKKDKKNTVTLMTGLQSLGNLRYLGAGKEITDLLNHRDFAVKKAAIAAIGSIRDIRLLDEMMQVIGLKVDTQAAAKEGQKNDAGKADTNESKKETVEEGYSWDGAEATVDRGEADNSQENADAKAAAEAQIAANKAAAEASAGSSGGDAMGGSSGGGAGLGGGGMSGGRGGSSRSTEELHPAILATLKKLTGQEFDKPGVIERWLQLNHKAVTNNCEHLDQKEEAQKQAK